MESAWLDIYIYISSPDLACSGSRSFDRLITRDASIIHTGQSMPRHWEFSVATPVKEPWI